MKTKSECKGLFDKSNMVNRPSGINQAKYGDFIDITPIVMPKRT